MMVGKNTDIFGRCGSCWQKISEDVLHDTIWCAPPLNVCGDLGEPFVH